MKKMVVLKLCMSAVAQGRKGTWAGKLSFLGMSFKKKKKKVQNGAVVLRASNSEVFEPPASQPWLLLKQV